MLDLAEHMKSAAIRKFSIDGQTSILEHGKILSQEWKNYCHSCSSCSWTRSCLAQVVYFWKRWLSPSFIPSHFLTFLFFYYFFGTIMQRPEDEFDEEFLERLSFWACQTILHRLQLADGSEFQHSDFKNLQEVEDVVIQHIGELLENFWSESEAKCLDAAEEFPKVFASLVLKWSARQFFPGGFTELVGRNELDA